MDFKKYDETKNSLGMSSKAMDVMKDQLLLVLFQRLGGDVSIPVSEIDGTGNLFMTMDLSPDLREFRFQVKNKN